MAMVGCRLDWRFVDDEVLRERLKEALSPEKPRRYWLSDQYPSS
jgi:hypothetical protein